MNLSKPARRSGDGRWLALAPRVGIAFLVAAMGLLSLMVTAPPASAHGGGDSVEAYILVQQALGHLAHDTGHDGMDLAMEKIDDALAAADQEGVSVALLQQAKKAVESENLDQARTLLQESIKEAMSSLAPATGEQTGTKVVLTALLTKDGLAGSDWLFLGASFVLLCVGVALAYRFRPVDTVSELRQRPGLSAPVVGGGAHRQTTDDKGDR